MIWVLGTELKLAVKAQQQGPSSIEESWQYCVLLKIYLLIHTCAGVQTDEKRESVVFLSPLIPLRHVLSLNLGLQIYQLGRKPPSPNDPLISNLKPEVTGIPAMLGLLYMHGKPNLDSYDGTAKCSKRDIISSAKATSLQLSSHAGSKLTMNSEVTSNCSSSCLYAIIKDYLAMSMYS